MRRRSARRGLAAIAAALLAANAAACAGGAASTAPSAPTSPLVVATADGQVRGLTTGKVDEYLGLPYAAPPVGRLRWQPPQAPAPWRGIRLATRFAPHCAQPASPFGQASSSENCLYLNVFVPAGHHDAKLPVMVWIHGGALVSGESNDYDPSALVAHGVIVVTFNYRLGALGFLAHPALADKPGGPSGDYGLMDQQAALRWVQRNIRAFGGNPRNVTIFGESAGGQSVLVQLASPTARGLFARAIAESGGYALSQASLASAEAAGRAFAAKTGCASQTAQCLRHLPVATILADQDPTGATIDIDGQVVTQQLKSAFADGQFNRVPVIDGSNHDEWRLFVALATFEGHPVTAANYVPMIATTLHVSATLAAIIASLYPLADYASPALALGAVGTDAIFACPTLLIDQELASYVPTFGYEFNDEHAPSDGLPQPGFPYGATHAAELQYLFGLPRVKASDFTTAQLSLAAAMRSAWTSFAETGVPSLLAGGSWMRFTTASQLMLSLIPPQPQPESDFAAEHHCSFWALGGD
jgi:para-nitrobenzyl esterase